MYYFFLRYSVVGVAFVFAAFLLWLPSMSSAQNKLSTDTVSISGLSEASKPVMQKAISMHSGAQLNWSGGQGKAQLVYDGRKTSRSTLLKSIALAGFDNSDYLAPDEAYQNLPAALRYERVRKAKWAIITNPLIKTPQAVILTGTTNNLEGAPLDKVIDFYLKMKDALVSTDSKAASKAGAEMLSSIKAVKVNNMPVNMANDWNNNRQQLESAVQNLTKEVNTDAQRQLFMSLSPIMLKIAKAAGYQEPLYYQFCPMANNGKGANWISQFAEIKNPYYGSMMLNCGQTVETIK